MREAAPGNSVGLGVPEGAPGAVPLPEGLGTPEAEVEGSEVW